MPYDKAKGFPKPPPADEDLTDEQLDQWREELIELQMQKGLSRSEAEEIVDSAM